jgi:hypothetical protein
VVTESRTWEHWREIPRVCLYRANLASSLIVAAVVGTLLFAINQLDLVLGGEVGPRIWVKAGLTYVVPFLVSNYRLVVGTRLRSA